MACKLNVIKLMMKSFFSLFHLDALFKSKINKSKLGINSIYNNYNALEMLRRAEAMYGRIKVARIWKYQFENDEESEDD